MLNTTSSCWESLVNKPPLLTRGLSFSSLSTKLELERIKGILLKVLSESNKVQDRSYISKIRSISLDIM